jgi:hypothetical protein
MSTLRKIAEGNCLLRLSKTGAIARHGPHHVAAKGGEREKERKRKRERKREREDQQTEEYCILRSFE